MLAMLCTVRIDFFVCILILLLPEEVVLWCCSLGVILFFSFLANSYLSKGANKVRF